MIARLTGTVVEILPTHIVLDVHEIGYLIAVRNSEACALDSAVTLHTHLAVRENALDLYGFVLRDELHMFELLITIPKIGPKSAMQILSQADLALLTTAIARNDASYLSKMSGISKKTAEKIVTELQSKFEPSSFDGTESSLDKEEADSIDALIALGYSQRQAREALITVSSEISGTNARIKAALKHLSTYN